MPLGYDDPRPVEGLESRGKHATFSSALAAVVPNLERLITSNPFDRTLQASWKKLFPTLPIRPGRFDPESGYLDLLVKNSPTLYAMRPKIKAITEKLKALPGCPRKFRPVLQIATYFNDPKLHTARRDLH